MGKAPTATPAPKSNVAPQQAAGIAPLDASTEAAKDAIIDAQSAVIRSQLALIRNYEDLLDLSPPATNGGNGGG